MPIFVHTKLLVGFLHQLHPGDTCGWQVSYNWGTSQENNGCISNLHLASASPSSAFCCFSEAIAFSYSYHGTWGNQIGIGYQPLEIITYCNQKLTQDGTKCPWLSSEVLLGPCALFWLSWDHGDHSEAQNNYVSLMVACEGEQTSP